MVYEGHRLVIPSNDEYSAGELRMMIAEVEIVLGRPVCSAEWSRL